jgi:outer membrane biogenesis lipoprotein LolB
MIGPESKSRPPKAPQASTASLDRHATAPPCSVSRALHPILILCLILSLFMQAGCAPRPTVVERRPEAVSDADLLRALQARTDYWKQFQAKLHLSAESSSKGKLRRIQTVALAALPDHFRLDAFTPMGQAAGAMVSNPGSSSLWIPSEGIAYQADRAETLIEHFIGVPVPLETLLYGLAACVPPSQLEKLEVSQGKSGPVARYKDTAGSWQFTWQFVSQPLALQSVAVQEHGRSYEIRYDPPVGLNVQDSAKKITFTASQWRMEATVDQISKPLQLQSTVFQLPLPGGIRTVKPGDPQWLQQNP